MEEGNGPVSRLALATPKGLLTAGSLQMMFIYIGGRATFIYVAEKLPQELGRTSQG